MCFSIIIVLAQFVALSNGAKIFAYVPTASFSHQVVFRSIWRELSLRGHQVTLITTDPINDSTLTNLTEVDIHSSYEIMNRDVMKIINSSDNIFKTMAQFTNMHLEILNNQMEHPAVKKLRTDPSQKFDIAIIEHLQAPPVAFAKKFDCPLIAVSSMPAFEVLNTFLGVPTHPVLYPDVLLPFDKAETLLERISSVVYSIFLGVYFTMYVRPKQDEAIEKYFGKGFGSADELTLNASLMLVNSNPILDRSRPTVPAIVYIAGIHKVPKKPLPEPLKSVLDSASDGFIYFSLGSNVKSKDISTHTRQVFLDTFAELPYQVLWKFELDNLPNKSDNIMISKWFPQTDILKHPNIKLFITQGGLQSMEEAIYEGVPMIGIPYFADQPGNVQKMVRKGFGLSLTSDTITKSSFKTAIMEVINNPQYQRRIKEISQLVEDQPVPALEQAIWWIEYVIRHKGTPHLRTPLLDIPWYQYLFLDVIGCLIVILIILSYLAWAFVKTLKNLFKSQKKLKLS